MSGEELSELRREIEAAWEALGGCVKAIDAELRYMNAHHHVHHQREETAVEALKDALPLLIRLGDFIANEQGRCETILKVRAAIEALEVKP